MCSSDLLGAVDVASSAHDDEFYVHDLLGLRVEDTQGRELGRVRDVYHNGAHEVLCYGPEGGAEAAIPFLSAFVPQVDLARGVVRIEPLDDVEPDRPQAQHEDAEPPASRGRVRANVEPPS